MTTRPGSLTKAEQSAATRGKLLDAAFAEFTEYGLAGGRVDRIAERAGVNKRLIYVYFTDKVGLFDAVVERDVQNLLDSVPYTPADLAAYAVALHDYLYDRPAIIALFAWRNLEQSTAREPENASYETKVARLREEQAAGRVDDTMSAEDLFGFLLALVGSWASPSPAMRRLTGDGASPDVRERRRAALRDAVRRLVIRPEDQART
jgi:AcrR family transcriptional regulator